jgi:hypothetical protein
MQNCSVYSDSIFDKVGAFSAAIGVWGGACLLCLPIVARDRMAKSGHKAFRDVHMASLLANGQSLAESLAAPDVNLPIA